MTGHTRPARLTRLIAERQARQYALQAERDEAARIAYETEVRAEVVAVLTARRYRLLSLSYRSWSGWWDARFCAAESDEEQHTAHEWGEQALYDHLRLHPVRVPRAPWVNGAALTLAFLNHAREGFQALAGFTRPR